MEGGKKSIAGRAPAPGNKNKRARDLGAMFSSLGFLLGVEIAKFEFTDCIRYRYT